MGFRNSPRRFIALSLLPAVALVLAFTYYPFARGIVMAFQNYQLFDLTNVHFIGFANFKGIFSDPKFKSAIGNTAYWVFISLILQFTIGLTVALLLNKRFRGRGIFQGFVFYPWALSGFLIGLIWKWMFNSQIGVINDFLLRIGVIGDRIGFLSDPRWAKFSVITANVWYGIAFFAIMLLAALQSVPSELYEAGSMDGAGAARKLFNITLPYIMPTVLTTTLLRAIWIFNDPAIIYGLTNGGPAGETHILSSLMLDRIMYGGDYGAASAIGIVMIGILLLYTIFYLTVTRAGKLGDF
ncbi:sugar ABC transporter permease [Cohnella sp. CBP 2801]|uniref:Sugar ABC transporter permease n=2 Tax=Cohnella zeiphila TaxID=2761120 RepID=A0A7X0SGB9_9BACL|nr:sugar ABC transporter permease [Cohnella zeiphila]